MLPWDTRVQFLHWAYAHWTCWRVCMAPASLVLVVLLLPSSRFVVESSIRLFLIVRWTGWGLGDQASVCSFAFVWSRKLGTCTGCHQWSWICWSCPTFWIDAEMMCHLRHLLQPPLAIWSIPSLQGWRAAALILSRWGVGCARNANPRTSHCFDSLASPFTEGTPQRHLHCTR